MSWIFFCCCDNNHDWWLWEELSKFHDDDFNHQVHHHHKSQKNVARNFSFSFYIRKIVWWKLNIKRKWRKIDEKEQRKKFKNSIKVIRVVWSEYDSSLPVCSGSYSCGSHKSQFSQSWDWNTHNECEVEDEQTTNDNAQDLVVFLSIFIDHKGWYAVL